MQCLAIFAPWRRAAVCWVGRRVRLPTAPTTTTRARAAAPFQLALHARPERSLATARARLCRLGEATFVGRARSILLARLPATTRGTEPFEDRDLSRHAKISPSTTCDASSCAFERRRGKRPSSSPCTPAQPRPASIALPFFLSSYRRDRRVRRRRVPAKVNRL